MPTHLTLPSGVPAVRKTKQISEKRVAPSHSPPSGKVHCITSPKGASIKMSMETPPGKKPKAC